MLTFVLSSGIAGIGDGFSWLQQALTGRSRYPAVASLYKKDIDARVNWRRCACNREHGRSLHDACRAHIAREHCQVSPAHHRWAGRPDPISSHADLSQTRQFAFMYPNYFAQQFLRDVQQYNFELMLVEQNSGQGKQDRRRRENSLYCVPPSCGDPLSSLRIGKIHSIPAPICISAARSPPKDFSISRSGKTRQIAWAFT